MKTNLNNCFSVLLAGILMTPPLALSACADNEIQRPEVTTPLDPSIGPEGTKGTISLSQIKTSTAFASGETLGSGTVNSTRIPAVVTAVDGSLLVFCEGRHISWKDVSYSDVMVKRSVDNGATWSETINLTAPMNTAKGYAFMDPTPLVDQSTGKVFLFCTRHNIGGADPENNRAILLTSEDNGVTWTAPSDVTTMTGGSGFGPSAGIQIQKGRFAGRLILNSRQSIGGVIVYSDDHGKTWKHDGLCAAGSSEATIAESGKDKLTMNIRKGANRYSAASTDGGITWTTAVADAALPAFESGCHACVYGLGTGMVIYSGPKGGAKSATNDNRYDLTIYRSAINGSVGSWSRSQQLTSLAAGYSSMTTLKDGSLVIVYEAGPQKGFGYYSGQSARPAGWMRIDVMVLPREVFDYDYWFEKQE